MTSVLEGVAWSTDGAHTVTLAAGVRWGDAYDSAQQRGRFVLGGHCESVPIVMRDPYGTSVTYQPYCACAPGFSGRRCETEVCGRDSCGTHGTCRAAQQPDGQQVAACICTHGYTGDHCETDACDSSPCQNSASFSSD